MTIYTCTRCGYITNHKANLVCHLRRKRPCEAILDDRSPADLLTELKVGNGSVDLSTQCELCKLTFASAFSLKRHLVKCKQDKQNAVVVYEKKIDNQQDNNTMTYIQGLQHQL